MSNQHGITASQQNWQSDMSQAGKFTSSQACWNYWKILWEPPNQKDFQKMIFRMSPSYIGEIWKQKKLHPSILDSNISSTHPPETNLVSSSLPGRIFLQCPLRSNDDQSTSSSSQKNIESWDSLDVWLGGWGVKNPRQKWFFHNKKNIRGFFFWHENPKEDAIKKNKI